MGEILNNVRAQVLVDALPYIQKYNNKILVVEYGGNAMTNKELKQAVMDDIVLLSLVGVKVVLVHGGGPEISDMLKRLNIESKFIGGLRYTDEGSGGRGKNGTVRQGQQGTGQPADTDTGQGSGNVRH